MVSVLSYLALATLSVHRRGGSYKVDVSRARSLINVRWLERQDVVSNRRDIDLVVSVNSMAGVITVMVKFELDIEGGLTVGEGDAILGLDWYSAVRDFLLNAGYIQPSYEFGRTTSVFSNVEVNKDALFDVTKQRALLNGNDDKNISSQDLFAIARCHGLLTDTLGNVKDDILYHIMSGSCQTTSNLRGCEEYIQNQIDGSNLGLEVAKGSGLLRGKRLASADFEHLSVIGHEHGLKIHENLRMLRSSIVQHLIGGECTSHLQTGPDGCKRFVEEYQARLSASHPPEMQDALASCLLADIASAGGRWLLTHVLKHYNISYDPKESLSSLRLKVKKRTLTRDKRTLPPLETMDDLQDAENEEVGRWRPQTSSSSLKKTLTSNFLRATSSKALKEAACACCGELKQKSSCHDIALAAINSSLLETVSSHICQPSQAHNQLWPHVLSLEDFFRRHKVESRGVYISEETQEIMLTLCPLCRKSLLDGRQPSLAIANGHFLGAVPRELQELTPVEESMIALCRTKCAIIQLQSMDNNNMEGIQPSHLPSSHDVDNDGKCKKTQYHSQKAFRGHVIIYPQRPGAIAKILPPNIDEISALVCILFVGADKPNLDWLQKKAKPLAVRGNKVRQALMWLKTHNYLYKDIEINEAALTKLPEDGILPCHIECIQSYKASTLVSRYDEDKEAFYDAETDVPFENVLISDIDGHATSNEIRKAAYRHMKGGRHYIQMPHDPYPENEFANPSLFPKMYPTLFPYGLGGFEDPARLTYVPFDKQVKHYLSLTDRRFQEHQSFLFSAFNIIQRRKMLLYTSLRVKKACFNDIAAIFKTISYEDIHNVLEQTSHGNHIAGKTEAERNVLKLMKEVQIVVHNVPGSAASKKEMRKEMRALMMQYGLPAFFITVNPADVYNPLVKFLAGANIDIDKLLPAEVPGWKEQSNFVAKNPVVAAKFFNIYVKALLTHLLGFKERNDQKPHVGALGEVSAYYGCVEAQGRGTLHCHLLLWIKGCSDPDEIKRRVLMEQEFQIQLIQYLEDAIKTGIDVDPPHNTNFLTAEFHPCSVRGLNQGLEVEEEKDQVSEDLCCLIKACQLHKHSFTCYVTFHSFRLQTLFVFA